MRYLIWIGTRNARITINSRIVGDSEAIHMSEKSPI